MNITPDENPEDTLRFAESFTETARATGFPTPDGFTGMLTAFITAMPEIIASDCQCTPCQGLRTALANMESP